MKNISSLQYQIEFSFEVDDTISSNKYKHNKTSKGQLYAQKNTERSIIHKILTPSARMSEFLT